jgi:hypothetical protein
LDGEVQHHDVHEDVDHVPGFGHGGESDFAPGTAGSSRPDEDAARSGCHRRSCKQGGQEA